MTPVSSSCFLRTLDTLFAGTLRPLATISWNPMPYAATQIRRPAPHHGAALDPQDRGDAEVRQRSEPHHHAIDGRSAIASRPRTHNLVCSSRTLPSVCPFRCLARSVEHSPAAPRHSCKGPVQNVCVTCGFRVHACARKSAATCCRHPSHRDFLCSHNPPLGADACSTAILADALRFSTFPQHSSQQQAL